ncbi:HAD superfamily hydrolase (TIGR01490 family) [Rhodococcus sp. LBL1]|uniref:HAD superfamily hydrolase (TIGR01490 family) n=1 Tax=Prescottella agglutinans TaxID=1644129 RepID=A0ABT6M4Z2_9NOCA|nr:HAD-IB family hydrolase [Prescottella agglutinans]MDH6278954.1 HAD superfamily hydrolase (TIGR01490 family) [Prescottella agglutinans]MDH6680386.1 HAD superfamily hydrolase (TIGR01490 family) [Rhodococcus sp. LBL1]MDH6685815.1 HAD superfamily hydrolase (TIGR01490 family) [Rhodococcus sp. LBL2]
MPGRSLPNGARSGMGLSGILRPGRRRIRNLLGPSEAELRANLAGEASADAALAMQEAEALEAAALEAAEAEALEAAPEVAEPPVEPAEPAVPRDLTAAAFFDVDNTMVQGASIIHFARGLAARKYLRTSDLVDFAWKQVKFRITGKENSDDVAEGREKALSFVAGRSTAELARLGEEIYDEVIADKIWAGTRALAQMHLDAGQQVWLVTATPVELAQVIAKRLGLTGALGTVAESRDGVFTGRLVGDILHGLGKAHAVRTLAIREGLNLKRCTAYSDSYNDVPMLSLVGTAVAVNPDADLRELAKNRGWEVRDFRTGRKAAKVGIPTALLLGAVGGAVGAILSRRRERALLAELAAAESGRAQPMKTLRRCASNR